MGMVVMSKRELNRLDVLARLDSDRLTARAAAELMAITPRQTYRLLRRYRDGGASAIANQRRGHPSNNRLPDVVRDHAIALVRERSEALAQRAAGLKRLADAWQPLYASLDDNQKLRLRFLTLFVLREMRDALEGRVVDAEEEDDSDF